MGLTENRHHKLFIAENNCLIKRLKFFWWLNTGKLQKVASTVNICCFLTFLILHSGLNSRYVTRHIANSIKGQPNNFGESNSSAFNNGDNTTSYNFWNFIWNILYIQEAFICAASSSKVPHKIALRFFKSVASSPISDKNGEPDISFTVLLSVYSPILFTISREVAKDLYVAFFCPYLLPIC